MVEESYRVIITSPDGRFGTKTLVGLNKKTARFEAKQYKLLGMVAKIVPESRFQVKEV